MSDYRIKFDKNGDPLFFIDPKVVKYMPKSLHSRIVSADKSKENGRTNYQVFLDDDTMFSADSVSELKWQASVYIKNGWKFGINY